MNINIDASWTDCVNAVGVIAALLLSAYQFRRQIDADRDGETRDAQQRQAEADRFQAEMEDRRRARLAANYPQFVQSMYDYAVAHARAVDSEAQWRLASPLSPGASLKVMDEVTAYRAERNRVRGIIATTALALSMDEPATIAARIEELQLELMRWDGKRVEIGLETANKAHNFLGERIRALQPRQ